MSFFLVRFFRQLIFLSILLICFPVESLTIYGHRGARGLAPENTLPGFQVALNHHVDYVDVDIVMTQDGILVAHHDLTLNPDVTRDAKENWVENKDIAIKDLTLQQLQTYDVGRIRPRTYYASIFSLQEPKDHTFIPTLQEVIREVKTSANYPVGFQIEIKTDPTQPMFSSLPEKIVIALDKVIREEGISGRTKVQAYDWRCLLLLQQLNPQIETAYLTDLEHEKVLRHADFAIAGQWTAGYLLKDYHDFIPEMIKALGGTWWDAEDIELTPAQFEKAHQLGLKVATWSNAERTGKDVDISLLKKLLMMQVDGIITDRPDVVRALVH
ncbi:MAG: glycerophosphodiester phosphodiesterase family protein [Legionellaceae bacterium]|nr:glycerophosphodiester phosphodiesterase family protein [Legionellaceae bacterium]